MAMTKSLAFSINAATGEELFMDARPFRLTRIKRLNKQKAASIGGNVVGDSVTRFLVTSSLAADGTLRSPRRLPDRISDRS
jgi:hypothetical protein